MDVPTAVPPVINETYTLTCGLGERYFTILDQYRDKLHQVDPVNSVTETKGSVRSRAIKVAIEIRARGVQENQVVLISSKTNFEQTVIVLACLFAGVVAAPIHVDLPYDELNYIAGILQPKIAFCGDRSARLLQRVFKEKNIKCVIFVFNGDGKDFLDFSKCLEHKEDTNYKPVEILEPKRRTAFILASHGTEHGPKIVALSHHSILMRYFPLLPFCTKSEKLLTFFPLSWISQILLTCLCFESRARIINVGQFTERGACKFIHDLRIELVFLDGNLATKIVKNAPIQDFDLSCLKVLYIGGLHLSQTNFARIAKTFKGVNIISSYSCLECGTISKMTAEMYHKNKDKLSSMGRLNPGVSIRVVDVTTRQPVDCDKWGELLVKTPGMMLGYYGDQNATNKAFNKGYFKTGDIVQYDSEGFLYVRGRSSDDIHKEDHVFSSCEIEDVIKLHPAVDDVAVFPTNDEIIACIVKKAGHELTTPKLMEYVSDLLPTYKHPTKVNFYEFFPKTLHGEVKKYILKENIIKLIREESFYHSEHIEEG